MISFIVPAHNEEALLPGTLRRLRASAAVLKQPYEILVVEDSSTDGTRAVAERLADRVVCVNLRHIAAVRNAGARVARGDVLVFVDADTLVPPRVLAAVERMLREGAVGGGAWVEMDPLTPRWGRWLTRLFCLNYSGLHGYAAGCFLYARRAHFDSVGGFDETYYASEEVHLSRALQRRGRFVIVRPAVVTSGRKLRLLTPAQILAPFGQVIRGGLGVLRRREGLEVWYGDGLREPR
jgi:glycosyltransferase involved in cell wall biosynthesis